MSTFVESTQLVCMVCGMVVPSLVDGWQCRPCRILEREQEDREMPPDDDDDDSEPPWETVWSAVPRLSDR